MKNKTMNTDEPDAVERIRLAGRRLCSIVADAILKQKRQIAELTAERDALKAEVEAGKARLAEAEFAIGGMHHLGTSTAAVNAATALNAYLEKYATKKSALEGESR